MFIIGGDAWLLSGGTCLKLPTSSPFMSPREVMQHDPDTKISVTKGGAETIEGTSTRTYAITVEPGGRRPGRSCMWRSVRTCPAGSKSSRIKHQRSSTTSTTTRRNDQQAELLEPFAGPAGLD